MEVPTITSERFFVEFPSEGPSAGGVGRPGLRRLPKAFPRSIVYYYSGINGRRRLGVARSTRVLSVSVPEALAEEIERLAREEGVSKSELVRLMARAYRRERSEEEFLRLQRELAPKGRALGVTTEEDVERVMLEDR